MARPSSLLDTIPDPQRLRERLAELARETRALPRASQQARQARQPRRPAPAGERQEGDNAG